jgi:REP element-mobilizing transposase RayT
MPNHVYTLILPFAPLPRIVSAIKAISAKKANLCLNRNGAFWAKDYFDRWVRGSAEEQRIFRYIENNLVKAGLCAGARTGRFRAPAQNVAFPT